MGTSEVPADAAEDAQLVEPQMMPQLSQIACGPCPPCPASPQLDQDAPAQQVASLSGSGLSQPSQITCAPCSGILASPQQDQGTHAQPAESLSPAAVSMPMMSTSPLPHWRCVHGSIVVAPAAPEMIPLGGDGSSVYVQW